MKKLHWLILIFVIATSSRSKAQDIILVRNGDERKVRVVRVSEKQVEFQKHSGSDKRILTFPLQDVAGIKYEQGYIVNVEGQTITSNEYDFKKYVGLSRKNTKQGITLFCIGGVLSAVSIPLLVSGLIGYGQTAHTERGLDGGSWTKLFLGGVFLVPTIPIAALGSVKMRRASKLRDRANALFP